MMPKIEFRRWNSGGVAVGAHISTVHGMFEIAVDLGPWLLTITWGML